MKFVFSLSILFSLATFTAINCTIGQLATDAVDTTAAAAKHVVAGAEHAAAVTAETAEGVVHEGADLAAGVAHKVAGATRSAFEDFEALFEGAGDDEDEDELVVVEEEPAKTE